MRRHRRGIARITMLLFLLCMCSTIAVASEPLSQRVDSLRQHRMLSFTDSLHRSATSRFMGMQQPLTLTTSQESVDSLGKASTLNMISSHDIDRQTSRRELRAQRLASFTPDPNKATWSAIVFPGGGQIYNHKYWKLPIVYGGFLGCAYALNWNNQMYSDYSQAYLDIMDDDPGTASYEDFLPPRYNVEANKDYLKRVFKNRKDNYRRQRDMSIFCFIGVYLLSVVDAYVDAELSNFDISEDLSMQVRPSIIDTRQYTLRNQSYGLQCSFSF